MLMYVARCVCICMLPRVRRCAYACSQQPRVCRWVGVHAAKGVLMGGCADWWCRCVHMRAANVVGGEG